MTISEKQAQKKMRINRKTEKTILFAFIFISFYEVRFILPKTRTFIYHQFWLKLGLREQSSRNPFGKLYANNYRKK
jgi:hypothetical protein